jgi:predicted RNase H-like HicB family nuclease
MLRYTVVLLPDEQTGAYTALVPALGGVVSVGDTVAEAVANVQEAITLYLESLTADEAELEVWRQGEPAGTAVVRVEVPPVAAPAAHEPVGAA